MHQVRIVNPRRFYIFIACLISLFVFLNIMFFSFASGQEALGAGEADAVPGSTITVHRGDSLWTIARPLDEESGLDIRYIIQQITGLNHLEDLTLHPGQTLELPNI